MINRTQLNAYLNKLPSAISHDELAQHKHIIERSFFGVDLFSCESDVLAFVGTYTGLEILVAFYNCKPRAIIVIETNASKFKRIQDLLNKNPELKERVYLFDNFSNSEINELIGERHVSVRISLPAFSRTALEYVTAQWKLDHICGEFNQYDIDPLIVYRQCARAADTFFWRIQDQHQPLTGSRQKYEYEVSVVVPAYNISAYIDQCIESLANQSIESLEILVVDDGTPDDSGEKADAWAARYPGRVKVIHKANGGCATARNAGVSQAKGQYIGFVDGDDWCDLQMYEDLFRAAVMKNADISQCGYKEAYETGEIVKFPLDINLSRLDLLRERPTMWRRIYSAEMLKNKGISFPEHIRRFDDLPFQFETFLNARIIANIPFDYYYYRQGRLGQDISVRDDRLYVHFPIFDWIYSRNSDTFNYDEERKLFELELDVHFWAWSVIDEKFQDEYFKQVLAQIFVSKKILSKFDMLVIAKNKGRERFMFYLKLLKANTF
ncbi:glycosyltransferase [Klebsiella aerogenes]|uniref:glycosyltransferase n=1 Tax=Klebsiella aerogenes TaxID=548 RepID=UPI002D8033A9|nr:glycosyltransferase [Klebsiella aerogenes]